MKKMKGRIISLLTVTALIATGTAPQAFAEAGKESPASSMGNNVIQEEYAEEQAYITGEIEDLRTRYSKTYEQSDGSRIAVVSAAPVHFYDEGKEEWEEYDNRLAYNEETENYESEENGSDMQVSLPKKIDEENGIEVEAEGYTVSITPLDMNSSSSKKTNEKKNVKSGSEKNLKEYSLEDYVSDSVLDGKVEYTQDKSAKAEYIFSGSELKENIVLSEVPEENQTYSFRIKADGLTAKLKKDNSVVICDGENKVFTIPTPYMYDSDFEFSSEIETTLKKDGSEYILTYAPDYEWLAAEERVYPVTVDPTVSTKPYNDKIVDTSVLSTAPVDLSSNTCLYAGALSNRNCVVDAYINFTKLPRIEKQWAISNAKLNLKTASDKNNKINAYKVTSEWKTSTVRDNPPSLDSTILDVCSVPAQTDTWVCWDITNTVYDWYNGGSDYGIKLSSPYATNNQSVFYSADAADSENIPYISVEYKTISSAQLENSRTIDIGRAGTATINDFSGNLTLTREDIGVDGNVMPVNISMIYNLNNIKGVLFGYGYRTNYSQTISYITDSGKNKFYEYICEDGSTVYFDEDEETGEYTDRSDRGYTLKNNGTKASDYSSIVITDSSEYEYHFDKYGRLIKIVNTQVTSKPSIDISYAGDYTEYFKIDNITDGVGRKYQFNYDLEKLVNISYYGNISSVIRKVEYKYSENGLSKVIYPDGKSVSYKWNTYRMTSAYNTDNYRVDFEYMQLTGEPSRVTGIKEYGSQGTKGADISVKYAPYQTKYINNSTGDTETLVFSNDGDLISTYDSQGAVTVNEYAKSSEAHGVSSLVNTYEHKKSETNLIANGEFESDVSGWQTVNDVNHPWDSQGHPGNSGSVKLVGHPNRTSVILQRIEVSGAKGDTYDIGGWAKANASSSQPFEIWVTFLGQSSSGDVQKISFNPYCTDWQYVMKNVQADSDYTQIQIAINYSGQINEAYFDGIVVYKGEKAEEAAEDSSSEAATDPEETTEPEPTTVIGSDGSVTTTEENDGIKTVSVVDKYENDLSNETIVDGISYKESKKYISSGNYLKSSEDSWETKTSYDYDENTGNLNSVNVHYNPINYTYDKAGNITKVSQNVNKLSNGTVIESSFTYNSGDRLSKITHNGFNYDLGYTEFGLLESIKAGKSNLINYGYDNDGIVTSVSYGNNQIIDYEYNDDKNKTAIRLNDKQLYNYKYDDLRNLSSIEDNVSGIVTNYFENSEGQNIIEETGDNYYHKLNSSENKRIEVIEDKSKQTDIISQDNSTEIKYKINDNYYSHYFKKTDKFERISNESVYRDGKTTSTQIYNKAYSYYSPGTNKTSERVRTLTFTGGYNKTFRYGYDAYGNISEINNIWYLYDEASQLTTEVDITTGTGKDYIYDKGGNITEVRHFTNGEYGETDTFTYGDDNWKDLLTEYNGNEITYDEIGNPLTYYNGTEFKWTMGRRLESVKKGNARISYKYNADGQRTSKIINGINFNYFWDGSKLTAQTWLGNTIYFYYDNNGVPIGFDYNNDHYYYITNLQRDIIAILSLDGDLVAEYEYDAWGNYNIISNIDGIADINPLRYRGYYYDSDTGLYYLQSRYYDANIGRFINADDLNVLISLDGFDKKVLGMNLFSYANNNPISNRDSLGFVAVVDDLTLACIACVLAIAGVASYTVTSSGNVSWSGGVISNSRQLDIASSTTVTVRTKTKSISDSLIRTQRITREKVNKADYLLATEVIYGSDRRGCNRNFIPIYPITRSAAIKALKKKKSIFTKFEHMAKGVAQNAGNGKTIHHTAKKAGYFSHHHPAKTVKMKNGKNKSVKKDGHAFYLGK